MTAPYYADDWVTVWLGDCLDVLATLSGCSVDAVVTDPPYGLEFMGKDWDGADGFRRSLNPADVGRDNVFGRASRTSPEYRALHVFQQWCQLWAAECLRVLRPGGHLLAFGGTRTWHRLVSAIEDAGFEIRDSIAWLYGSGFPKSLDVSKAIDRRGGNPQAATEIAAAIKSAREARGWTTGQADRHFCGGSTNWTWFEGRKGECRPPTPETFERIVAEWPELASWAQMVAEVEREVVGRSAHRSGIGNGAAGHYTVGGTVAEHVDITAPATAAAQQWQGWGTALKPAHEPICVARKPLTGTVAANVLAYGTGALNIDAARIPGETVRTTRNTAPGAYETPSGGRWPANVALDETQAAALDQMSGELGLSTTSSTRGVGGNVYGGGEGFSEHYDASKPVGYGDIGGASRFFYTAKADSGERITHNGVAHPTVKPLDLMRWLVRLVTPPGGVVLDCFAGSGTTVEAALLEGFQCIAIEREPDYLPLITQRINRRRDPVAYLAAAGEDMGLLDFEEPA